MSNPRRVVLLVLAAAVLAGAVAYAQEVPPPRFITPTPELKIQADSRIQSVTVFADWATVVRTAAIRPILGPRSVVFPGLPTSIIGGSLRAAGRGTVLGDRVTVGHGAILHAGAVEDDGIIGMGAIVLDGAVIKKGTIAAAGALVPRRKTNPAGSLVLGSRNYGDSR